jgi:hypothetical protein
LIEDAVDHDGVRSTFSIVPGETPARWAAREMISSSTKKAESGGDFTADLFAAGGEGARDADDVAVHATSMFVGDAADYTTADRGGEVAGCSDALLMIEARLFVTESQKKLLCWANCRCTGQFPVTRRRSNQSSVHRQVLPSSDDTGTPAERRVVAK